MNLPRDIFESIAREMAHVAWSKTASVISMRGDGVGEFNYAPTEADMLNRVVAGSAFQRRSGMMPTAGRLGPGTKGYIISSKGGKSPRGLDSLVGLDTRPTFGMSDEQVFARSGVGNMAFMDSPYGKAHTVRAR